MILFRLTYPGVMPDLNTVIDSSKRHWHAYSGVKRATTEAVQLLAQATWRRKPPIDQPVAVCCRWECSTRRKDPDNVAFAVKYLLDGLVKAGVLENDGPRQVASIAHEFVYGVEKDMVTIELKEAA